MHELMVTESILEIALRHAGQAGAVRVTDLFLVVGDLSSIVDDSVQFYWDFVSEGTAAEGAPYERRSPLPSLRQQQRQNHVRPGILYGSD
jgi:hydrogenase nickel incorporation protein HypA/HybF